MQNVTISNDKRLVGIDTPVRLNNGSLVLHYNKGGDVIGAYLVTSYRDHRGSLKNEEHTKNYCSLVNLDTGYLKFEERCSRLTTIGRVLAHLSPSDDFGGKEAFKSGQYIEVYLNGDYKINIQI